LYLPTSVITKAIRTPRGSQSAHLLKESDFDSLYDGIKNAPGIIYNRDRNAVVYITENKDSKGNYIIAAFDLNNDLYGENAHKATSVYGRESIGNLLNAL
jgi:hypothetical protein